MSKDTNTYSRPRKYYARLRSARPEMVIMVSGGLIASVLILYPLGSLFYQSITSTSGSRVVFTLNHYLKVLSDKRLLRALLNTLYISLITTFLATLMGSFLAWIVARTNTPFKKLIESLSAIPFFVSAMVISIAWMYLAAPRVGILNKFLVKLFSLSSDPLNIYSFWGIILVMTLYYVPEAYLFTVGTFKNMDPSLEESARICGSGVLKTTLRVTMPLSAPAILSCALLIFVSSAGVFGVPLILGIPVGIRVLSTQIYSLASQYPLNYGGAAAAAGVLLLISCVGIALNRRLLENKEFTTVSAKGFRPSVIDLKAWKYVTLIFALFYIFFAIVLPFSALTVVAFSRVWEGVIDFSQFTWANFSYVLFKFDLTMIAIKNSLFLGIFGSFCLLLFALILAYLLLRTRVKGRALLDYITSIPMGVPGIVMGTAMLMAWIRTPLYGTIWILMVAFIARFFPYGIRIMSSGLRAISYELDECSRITGASWVKTMKKITIPLLKPSITAGWILLFILFMKELPVAVLLSQTGTSVMAVALITLVSEKLPGETASFALIHTVMVFVATVIYRKATRGHGEMSL